MIGPTRAQVRALIAATNAEGEVEGDRWLVFDGCAQWDLDVDALTDAVMALLAETQRSEPKPIAYGVFDHRYRPADGPEHVMVRVEHGQEHLHIDGRYAIYRMTDGPTGAETQPKVLDSDADDA